MNAESEEWKRWVDQPYEASAPSYRCDAEFGTPDEPGSSLWCASLLEPVREFLEEPFGLLDLGCGDGRLFDFLSRRFLKFDYYGIERPGEFGNKCAERAGSTFGHDARARFSVYGTPAFADALGRARIVVMGSVATHIPIRAFEDLLKQVMPVLERGGALTSSFFIREKYELKSPFFCYGHSDCYAWVSYTQKQVDGLFQKMALYGEQKETFVTCQGDVHQILRIRRKEGAA